MDVMNDIEEVKTLILFYLMDYDIPSWTVWVSMDADGTLDLWSEKPVTDFKKGQWAVSGNSSFNSSLAENERVMRYPLDTTEYGTPKLVRVQYCPDNIEWFDVLFKL